MEDKFSVLEADFVNNWIAYAPNMVEAQLFPNSAPKKVRCDSTISTNFLNDVVPDFWHDADKDRLEFFKFYSNGEYFCQRSKKAYDFETETSYWKTYSFHGATTEQAKEMQQLLYDYYAFSIEVKDLKVRDKIEEINQEAVYFEAKYMKIRRQRDEMLNLSDWRVLPDIVDSYEGEKDRWVAWRSLIRNVNNLKPADFDNNLEYFKYTFECKFPVDPVVYRELYPNEMLEDGVTPAPAYLDVNDPNQWRSHDTEASSDFFHNRELNIYNMSRSYNVSRKKVRQAVLDLLRLTDAESVVPVDWSVYYVNDSELEA